MAKRRMQKNTKRNRTKRRIQLYTRMGLVLLIGIFIVMGGMKLLKLGPFNNRYREVKSSEIDAAQPDLDVELLTVNEYSRPGTKTNRINGIVIHYTANPGSTAMQNRDYFEGLKDSHITKASSHFIVGLEGEIVQCIPTWEEAYASNERNADTVSIETCHLEEDGKYTAETYKSMVQLTAWLCKKFDLTEKDVIRHYDITGKICPKYFVEDEGAWEKFLEDVSVVLKKM